MRPRVQTIHLLVHVHARVKSNAREGQLMLALLRSLHQPAPARRVEALRRRRWNLKRSHCSHWLKIYSFPA